MGFRYPIVTALLMDCLLLSGCMTSITPDSASDYFPMRRGTRWLYATHSEVSQTGGGLVTNDADIVCQVLDVYVKEAVTAARLRGFPMGMDVWSGCTNCDDASLLVCIPGSQYHVLDPTVAGRFADTNDSLSGLIGETSLFLDCPLAAEKRYGEFDQLVRADFLYSWRVVSEKWSRISGVKGVSPWIWRRVYQLEYRTLPDCQRVIFVPGIGIVAYNYHHNGTPCDVRMRLEAFKQPE